MRGFVFGRTAADGLVLCAGFLTGLITARSLGPADKGILATILFIAGFGGAIATAGLGDSAVFAIGRGQATARHALSVTLTAAAIAATLAGVLVVGASWLEVGSRFSQVVGAVILGAFTAPVIAGAVITSQVLNATGAFKLTNGAYAVSACVMMVLTAVAVLALHLGIEGAMAASLGGNAVWLLVLVRPLRGRGLVPRPRWDSPLLRLLVPYGLKLQASSSLILLTGRVDVLLVFALAGSAPAGNYSVSLTVAGVVGIAPVALSYVAFPSLTAWDDATARATVGRHCRLAILVSSGLAIPIAALAIPGVALVFGAQYQPAVTPLLILLPSYILSSVQWILARGAAAQGRANATVLCYGANVAGMVLADIALIPLFGIIGAAVGDLLGSIIGLVVVARLELASGHLMDLIPGRDDIVHLRRALMSDTP